MMKRVFLIVLDSVGIGEMPDAAEYGDAGSNTIAAAATSPYFHMPNMRKLGFFNIDGVTCREGAAEPAGAVARMAERSKGKDTTIGHWEIAGTVSDCPLPTFPDGFPRELLDEFEKETGRKVLCNKPYSGTEVIKDYGEEHLKTGALIVYTSADSVFQIAAHESIVPIEELYRYCEIARRLCTGRFGVGRVIARPFEGKYPFKRTSRRHDYSLEPPKKTMLNYLKEAGRDVLAVGKINDIFAGSGVTGMVRTVDNKDGIDKTLEYAKQDFSGLCFTNLVDYDMLYGHRNDKEGYAKALTYFDERLPELLAAMREEDLLLITADHGCDPSTPSTDHSREYTPLVMAGTPVKAGVNLGTRSTFADIAATILDYLGVEGTTDGESFWPEIRVEKPYREILAAVDHTLLHQESTWEEIKALCDDAIRYGTASVCIPPSFVKRAKEYVGERMAVCTVIGFPNGYNTTAVKVFETQDAVANGADEIDMVINIGDLKAGEDQKVLAEIRAVKEACAGRLLKVIIETCLLTEEEKVRMCHIVTEAGAEYIKTSTGFSTAGATFEDVALFAEHVGEGVKIKAAGGIGSMEDAMRFMELGASRLGTSRIVKIVKEEQA